MADSIQNHNYVLGQQFPLLTSLRAWGPKRAGKKCLLFGTENDKAPVPRYY